MQSPPRLGNQYDDDRVLRSYLARVLPEQMLREIEPSLRELGGLAGDDLYHLQLADRLNEPTLTQWDPWGNRIDQIEVTPMWREAERIAVEYGLVATAYEQRHGSLSRVHECALAYLFTSSTDIYSCPLAMTDGAARTLLSSGNQALIDRVVPHLITRNAEDFWTAGQWMTEITGGSDVGLSQTVAKQEGRGIGEEGNRGRGAEGNRGTGEKGNGQTQQDSSLITHDSSLITHDSSLITHDSSLITHDSSLITHDSSLITHDSSLDLWRLYGNKWFASAITSDIALTLARPEGNPPGGRGLALFYIELRATGRLRNIEINRLKDKLGTRKVPTAELTLAGTPAVLVKGPTDGVRNIAPLLNITRLWNGISAVALMRRGIALASDYARRRIAFGAPLSEKPLHLDTLAGLQAEAEAAFHLAFYVAELTGRAETAGMVQGPTSNVQSHIRTGRSSDRDGATQVGMSQGEEGGLPPQPGSPTGDPGLAPALLLRLLTPVMKLTTGKQAVQVLSEVLEAFGGAGYVEDTGLPQLLRDAQVLPIWEGTTNVLSLDTLRALGRGSPRSKAQSPTSESFQAFKAAVTNCLDVASDPSLSEPVRVAQSAMAHAETWVTQTANEELEAGARRFAITLGRTMELTLLIQHAQWCLDNEADSRATAAARRFASSGIDLLADHTLDDARTLFP